jgi:hypothetical protein
MRHYYAEHSPRGFANEINTYRFATKDARDKWIDSIDFTENVNQRAGAITAAEARKNVRYKGDWATKSYNSGYIDGDQAMADELAEEEQRKAEIKQMFEWAEAVEEEYQHELKTQNQ